MFRCRFLLPAFSLLTLAIVADASQGQYPLTDHHGDALPPGAIARLGTMRFRHDSAIVFAGFHPSGKSVVSVSSDGVVCAWEFPSGKQVRRFEVQPAAERQGEPAAEITKASLSPDGKHVTAFCSDGFVRVWDWASAKQLGKMASGGGGGSATGGAGGGVVGLAALGLFGGGLGVDQSGPVFDHSYSPDGKVLLHAASPRVLQFMDLSTGKEMGPGLGHTHSLASIAFSADGGQLLTQDSKSTRTWDAKTGKETAANTIKRPAGQNPMFGFPTSSIISPDGRLGGTVTFSFNMAAAAVGGVTVEAVLFDTANGKTLRKIALDGGPNGILPAMVFSADSKLLALEIEAKQKVELYEVSSGKLLRTFDAPVAAQPGQNGGIPGLMAPFQKLLFSADGKVLAFQGGPGAAIVVRDTESGKEVASVAPVKGGQATLRAFSPDRRCLALEMGDGTVTFFELATGQPRRTYGTKRPPAAPANNNPFAALLAMQMGSTPSDGGMAVAPDLRLLALSGPGGAVHLWDMLTGKELTALKGHTAPATALAFAPGGKTLASASADTTVLLWDVAGVKRSATAESLQAGDLAKHWEALAGADAVKAFEAIAALAAAPKEAVPFLQERVKPAAPLDAKRVEELLAQLDANQFKVREAAASELLKIGDGLVPAVEKALASKPPLESQRRLENLRDKLTVSVLQGDRLRIVRAVEVLDVIGTPEARQILQTLAEGAPGALVTASAQAALRRSR